MIDLRDSKDWIILIDDINNKAKRLKCKHDGQTFNVSTYGRTTNKLTNQKFIPCYHINCNHHLSFKINFIRRHHLFQMVCQLF